MIEGSEFMKKKFKTWEKIFIITSILIIIAIIGIYAYRTIYYYKKTNHISVNAKLADVITNEMNVVYTGNGLYKEDDNTFYFSGKETNNYLLYLSKLWRIVGIDATGIKIITEKPNTTLVWGINSNYENSIIYKWLNQDNYINTLNQNDIVDANWCNESIDINNYHCNNEINAKVGLITTDEYLKAGGINSYLNNETYFWTLNTSEELKAYYVHSEGGINNEVSSNNTYHSYGIRPVIYLNKDIIYLGGKGTETEPYIIENNQEIAINDHPIGSYVSYQGYTWQILSVNEDYTKLVLDGYLSDENNEPIKLPYNKVNSYLNNTFINNLKKDNLVKFDSQVTEYNNANEYNYNTKKNNNSYYVTIPIVSDLFINEYSFTWLNTYANSNQKLVYTTTDESSLYADLESSENYIRPIIAIKNGLIIASGNGTKNNPFILGDE